MASGPDTRPTARAPLLSVALAFCIGIGLLSCGGGDGAAPTAAPPSTPPTPPPPPAPTVASLEVSGTAVLTSIGETTQFMVTATLSDGSMQAVEAAEADWESSDPAVATVSEGVLTAAGGGNATITVTFGGRSAEVAVSVRISVRTEGAVRVLYRLAGGPAIAGRLQRNHLECDRGGAVLVPPPDRWTYVLSSMTATPGARCRTGRKPSDDYAQRGRVGEDPGRTCNTALRSSTGPAEFRMGAVRSDVKEECGEPA